MLSDRIKKFGIKSKENNESGQTLTLKEHENLEFSAKPKTESASISANTDSKLEKESDNTSSEQAELLRRNMAETLERVTAEKSEAIDLFVKTKLAEVDKKIAQRENKSERNSDLYVKIEEEKKQDEVPLILRYSAALKNIQQEASVDVSESDAPDKKAGSDLSDVDKNGTQTGVVFDKAVLESEKDEENGEGGQNQKIGTVQNSESIDTDEDNNTTEEKKISQLFNFGWTVDNKEKTEPDTEPGQNEAGEIEAEVIVKPVIVSKACMYAPALVAVISALLIVMSKLSISSLERRDNIYLSFAVLQIIILLIPAIFYCKLRRGNDISNLRLVGINPDKLYFTILTAFLLLFISASFKLLYIKLGIYDSGFAEYASYVNISSFTSVSDIVYMIITFVLIPAVSEEFIFRSVVFGEYVSDKFGYLSAAVISSVLYAFIQTSLTRMPVYFIIGMILVYVSVMTGSVIASMITSVVYRLLDVFTERYIVSLMNSDYRILLAFVVISLAFLFLTLFFAEAERLYYNRGTSGETTPKRDVRSESTRVLIWAAFSSPSFIVCFVIFIIGILIKML